MNMKHWAAAGMLGLALGGASLNSHAVDITIPDGSFAATTSNFGGIDWAASGKAVVQNWFTGDVAVGDTINSTLDFWASAVTVTDPNQNSLQAPSAGILFDEYELTIAAQITEQATCNAVVGTTCVSASFILLSGSWDIYYDAAPINADVLAGTGFTDGIRVLGGVLTPGFAGNFTATATGGTGSNALTGVVNFTNNDFFSPDLVGTNVGTEIKFGTDRTDGGGLPTGTPFSTTSITCNVENGVICLQADANQSFVSAVPEPATIALLGLGLLGLTAIRRRIV